MLVRWQAIIWINDGLVPWCIYVSIGLNDLTFEVTKHLVCSHHPSSMLQWIWFPLMLKSSSRSSIWYIDIYLCMYMVTGMMVRYLTRSITYGLGHNAIKSPVFFIRCRFIQRYNLWLKRWFPLILNCQNIIRQNLEKKNVYRWTNSIFGERGAK